MELVRLEGGALHGEVRKVGELPGDGLNLFFPVRMAPGSAPIGPYQPTGETYIDDRDRLVHVVRFVGA